MARTLGTSAGSSPPAAAGARPRAHGPEHQDPLGIATGLRAGHVAPVGRAERVRELELDEPEALGGAVGQSGYFFFPPPAGIAYLDGEVGTTGFDSFLSRSIRLFHWPGFRTTAAACPSFLLSPKSGRNPMWMWFA